MDMQITTKSCLNDRRRADLVCFYVCVDEKKCH